MKQANARVHIFVFAVTHVSFRCMVKIRRSVGDKPCRGSFDLVGAPELCSYIFEHYPPGYMWRFDVGEIKFMIPRGRFRGCILSRLAALFFTQIRWISFIMQLYAEAPSD